MTRLLGSALKLSAREISQDNIGRTKRPPRRTSTAASPASCHVLIFRFMESAEMVRASTLVACSMPPKWPPTPAHGDCPPNAPGGTNPVEVAPELRAQPVVMLARRVAVVNVAAIAVEAAAATAAAAVAVAVAVVAAAAVDVAAAAAAVVVGSAARLL